jgi:hypothetical protein
LYCNFWVIPWRLSFSADVSEYSVSSIFKYGGRRKKLKITVIYLRDYMNLQHTATKAG